MTKQEHQRRAESRMGRAVDIMAGVQTLSHAQVAARLRGALEAMNLIGEAAVHAKLGGASAQVTAVRRAKEQLRRASMELFELSPNPRKSRTKLPSSEASRRALRQARRI